MQLTCLLWHILVEVFQECFTGTRLHDRVMIHWGDCITKLVWRTSVPMWKTQRGWKGRRGCLWIALLLLQPRTQKCVDVHLVGYCWLCIVSMNGLMTPFLKSWLELGHFRPITITSTLFCHQGLWRQGWVWQGHALWPCPMHAIMTY